MLENRVYIGKICHKGQVFEGKHPAIIDRDTFEKVGALRKKTEKKKESLIIEKKIKKIEKKITKLLELYTDEEMSGIKEISKSISKLDNEKKSLETYRKEVLKDEEKPRKKKDITKYISSISHVWEKSTSRNRG